MRRLKHSFDPLEDSLIRLAKEGVISSDTAISKAKRPEIVEDALKAGTFDSENVSKNDSDKDDTLFIKEEETGSEDQFLGITVDL